MIKRTARHCKTLQDTATHCNTLQHTATHCNTLQHNATQCNALPHSNKKRATNRRAKQREALQYAAKHCNKLHCTCIAVWSRRSVLQRVAVCCSVLQCVAVCCSVLQCVAKRKEMETKCLSVRMQTKPRRVRMCVYMYTYATHCNTLQYTDYTASRLHKINVIQNLQRSNRNIPGSSDEYTRYRI